MYKLLAEEHLSEEVLSTAHQNMLEIEWRSLSTVFHITILAYTRVSFSVFWCPLF